MPLSTLTPIIREAREKLSGVLSSAKKIADKSFWQKTSRDYAQQMLYHTTPRVSVMPGGGIQRAVTVLKKYYFPETLTTLVVAGVIGVFMLGFAGQRSNAPIVYQGRLMDTNYTAVADGTYYMRFSVWNHATATSVATNCVWRTETSGTDCDGTAASVAVTVSRGLFTVTLGSGGTGNPEITQSFNSSAYYLGVTQCGTGDSCESEMSPRKQLGGSLYAYNADTLDGINSTSFAMLAGQSSGQSLIGGTAANETLTLQGNSATSNNTAASSSIVFKVGDSGATTAMTILNNGNVGIGRTDPELKLDVLGADNDANYHGVVRITDTSAYNAANGAGGGVIFGYKYNSSGAYTYGPYIRGVKSNTTDENTASELAFGVRQNGTSPAERMRIDKDGNVGIGTSTPSEKLHIYTSTADSNAKLKLEAVSTGQSGITLLAGTGATNRATRIDFLNGVASTSTPRWTLINDYNQDATNDLSIVNSDPSTRVFTILQSGNVGIGTTSPTANFQVAQATTGTGLVSVTAASTTVTGTNTLFTNTFKVGDTITANSETRTISAIASNTSMTTDAWTGTAASVAYTLAGGSRLFVNGNGNVGIAGSPSSILDIGSGAWAVSQYGSGANGWLWASTGYGLLHNGSNWITKNTVSTNGGTMTAGDVYGNLRFFTATSTGSSTQTIADADIGTYERMRINGLGNVGIGTTAPVNKLTVAGIDVAFRYSGSNDQVIQFEPSSTAAGGTSHIYSTFSGTATEGKLSLGTYSFQDTITLTGGYVGIGTATPNGRLEVEGGVDSAPAATGNNTADFNFRYTPGGTNLTLDFGGNTTGAVYNWIQSRNLTDYTANYSLALNPNGGNVGIGTTAPVAPLDIFQTGAVSDGTGKIVFKTAASSTNSDPNFNIYHGRIASTDTTTSTLNTLTTVSSTVYSIEARVTARNTSNGNGGSFLIRGSFRTDSSNAVTQIGATQSLTSLTDDGGWGASLSTGSGQIKVDVQNTTSSQNITWHSTVFVSGVKD